MTDITDSAANSMSSPANGNHQFNAQSPYVQEHSQQAPGWALATTGPSHVLSRPQNHATPVPKTTIESTTFLPAVQGDSKKATLNPVDETSLLLSRGSTVSGQDEEAVVYSNTRMLQDPTGRLCQFPFPSISRNVSFLQFTIQSTDCLYTVYIGDSATLSFLQLIRMIVDNVAGPSSFTMDPRRHRIVENTITLPPNMRQTHLLPDRQTANILVEAFFTHVSFIYLNRICLIHLPDQRPY